MLLWKKNSEHFSLIGVNLIVAFFYLSHTPFFKISIILDLVKKKKLQLFFLSEMFYCTWYRI